MTYPPALISEFIRCFEKLFEFIEQRHGKQLAMFSLFPAEQDTSSEHASHVQTHNCQFVKTYLEGTQLDVIQTAYERSHEARRACLDFYGLTCTVCGFDFEEVYGAIGSSFIHVHHETPLASASGEHEVNPMQDLKPVCPNCHGMLHRKTPPYTIEALKEILQRRSAFKSEGYCEV